MLLAISETSDIDWDNIEIESRWEEEGTQEIPNEEVLYLKLGLRRSVLVRLQWVMVVLMMVLLRCLIYMMLSLLLKTLWLCMISRIML